METQTKAGWLLIPLLRSAGRRAHALPPARKQDVHSAIAPALHFQQNSISMSSSRRQYPFHLIEPKWQQFWDAQQTFRAFNPGEVLPDGHPFARRHQLSGQMATGGYAKLMASKLPEISAVEPNLTLEGLRLTWEADGELRNVRTRLWSSH